MSQKKLERISESAIFAFAAISAAAIAHLYISAGAFGDFAAQYAVYSAFAFFAVLGLALLRAHKTIRAAGGWTAMFPAKPVDVKIAQIMLSTLCGFEAAAIIIGLIWWDATPLGAPMAGISSPLRAYDLAGAAYWREIFWVLSIAGALGFTRLFDWLGAEIAKDKEQAV